MDGLATLGASTLTVPTGRVATAPLLLPYKPAAAAMRMHLAGDAAVHVITGQQHGNCCHFSSRPSFEVGFVSIHTQRDRAQAAQWRDLRCDALRDLEVVPTKNPTI